MTSRRVLLLTALLVAAACAGAAGRRSSVDPDLITPEEIRASDAANAYELVERLRPRWLIARGDRSINLDTVILVYEDGVRLGGIETLRDLQRPLIHSLRVLDAAEAGKLPGMGSQHVQRVIQVLTHPR